MIITITGKPGSGKSVVARALAKKLKLKHYSSGDFFRKLAKKRHMTVIELNKYAKTHTKVDKYIDNRQKQLGRTKDNFVIDGRLAFYFIPNSIKIFLDVSQDEAARRIFKHKRKLEKYKSIAHAKKQIIKRYKLERKRFKKLYKIDPYSRKNFDFYLSTTGLTISKSANRIIKFLKSKK